MLIQSSHPANTFNTDIFILAMLKLADQDSLFRPTFCINVNLDPVIVDDWQQGVIFDEVGQKGIRILGNLIHFCPNGQQEVIFGILNWAFVTHLERPQKNILVNIIGSIWVIASGFTRCLPGACHMI